MTLSTSPAPARSDARPAPPAAGDTAGLRTTVRRGGAVLAAGAAAWAVGTAAVGINPDDTTGLWVQAATALAFQLGLVALLTVYRRTRALGTGRVARAVVVVEHALLAGAMLNTLDPALPFLRGTALHLAFDICWPLSMLGMFGIGVRMALAGRWTGAARVWPLVAETWAVVVIPLSGLLPGMDRVISPVHLLVGYTTLGLVLATRPQLARRR
ncbi:hypothetical protein [Modestobacter sp. NPDC049651]|uniref:hypothetical protein n=1 Tax=unclassified Modestobacter TaxID=2643866 RepID=UPI0034102C8A